MTVTVAPALTPVVYLRGAGVAGAVWARIPPCMWARGWATTRARTQAWHLAFGGVPVVLCDFSGDGGVTVGRVRARGGAQTAQLPVVGGPGRVHRPYRPGPDGQACLDEGALAELVGQALGI